MRKKILFTIRNLELGGIEKAFINLMECIDYEKYDVDVLIQEKEGIFLEQLSPKINIIDFNFRKGTTIFHKILNRIKLFLWSKKIANKYDFSCCYTTWCFNSAKLARVASENSALWIHGDFYLVYNKDKDRVREFFDNKGISEFKHVISISESTRDNLMLVYPELEDKVIVCNNCVNVKKILSMSEEDIDIKKEDIVTFVNVSRHDEVQKSLSRIIEASEKLNNDGLDFRVLMIGDGQDTEKYRKMINEKGLEEKVLLLGKKSNPYPYFKIADASILCSNSEGYGLANIEAMILGVPVVSTDVAGMADLIDNRFGIIVDKSSDGVYLGMKRIIEEGFEIKEKYDANIENSKVINKLDVLVNG